MRCVLFLWCALLAAQTSDLSPRSLHGFPVTVIYVSHIVPFLDATAGCNWLTGVNSAAGACADDSSYVNTALSSASAANPVDLIFDVSIAIGSPVAVSAYVRIEGLGMNSTGVFVLAGSNSTAICIGTYSDIATGCGGGPSSGTPPTPAGYAIISNLGIQGNRTGGNGSGNVRCSNWCFGIAAYNLAYFEVTGVEVYDAPTFGILTSNITRQVYRNATVISPSGAINTDGIHMDGPCGTFDIEGAYLQTGDDGIALNLPEGYSGNCSGGTIANVTYKNALTALRIYTYLSATSCSSSCVAGPVVMQNLTGSLAQSGGASATFIRLGNSPSSTVQDSIQSIQYSNVNLTTQYWVDAIDSAGSIIGTGNNIWVAPGSANPALHYSGSAGIGISLFKPGLTIYRNSTGSAAAYFGQISSGLTVQTLDLSDSRVVNEKGQSISAIADAITIPSGGVATTYIAPNDNSNITAATNTWTGVTRSGCSGFFTGVTYSLLPGASISTGCSATITDSAALGIWGATESGGSAGHYAQLNSNGTNWTVTGK